MLKVFEEVTVGQGLKTAGPCLPSYLPKKFCCDRGDMPAMERGVASSKESRLCSNKDFSTPSETIVAS
jgi:hypothetical protein